MVDCGGGVIAVLGVWWLWRWCGSCDGVVTMMVV